mmetsp:Transcript_11936/g.17755  ORF Transcript_11936/g.17755 Transcript_11936/m.17755 type:complete len:274 (+) Transcript_11936:59-880(+)
MEYDLRKCIEKLGEKEKKILKEFQNKIENWEAPSKEWEEEKKRHCTELTAYRFIFGYEWKIEEAETALKKCIDWRVSYKPQDVKYEECKLVAEQGFLYQVGYDKHGHPLVWIEVAKHKLENTEEVKASMFRLLVYIVEKELNNAPEHVHRLAWMIELKDASLSIAIVKSLKDLFYNLGEYYPERMARAVVLNASWWMNAIWAFAKQFMTKTTIEKYKFIKGSSANVRKELSGFIDPEKNLSTYSTYGDLEWKYDYEEEVKKDHERQKEAQQEE